jgi:hypothetical protein
VTVRHAIHLVGHVQPMEMQGMVSVVLIGEVDPHEITLGDPQGGSRHTSIEGPRLDPRSTWVEFVCRLRDGDRKLFDWPLCGGCVTLMASQDKQAGESKGDPDLHAEQPHHKLLSQLAVIRCDRYPER